jgi:hypothetical protein
MDSGGARAIKIDGKPDIPERLRLSAAPALTGWLADYYDEPLDGPQPAWEKRGAEIFGRAYEAPATPTRGTVSISNTGSSIADVPRIGIPGSMQESLLQYHRPMLEDGEISYEFYYEPGKAQVHPALDRLAFLLAPEGVAIHRLTDAQYDRTGLDPGNFAVEPAHRRGPGRLPLKPRDWNRLELALAGDVVTLRLNGVAVYERPLESSNNRTFGLFHYADTAEARVRNVEYRGDWPRSLPESLTAAPGRPARGE